MKKKYNKNKNKNTENVMPTANNDITNSIRYDQVYFRDGVLTDIAPELKGSFPGSPYVDLGTASKLYSEITSTRDIGQSNDVGTTPVLLEFGTIGTNDSGADWVKSDSDDTLVPNAVAEQIELKLGLVESKIRNAMFTELDILQYVPTINTMLSSDTVANGQLYTRFLLASKYNSFMLARYWADLQATVSALISIGSRNKLLTDRVNLLINELKRAKIRAALQSLHNASAMIMTDAQVINNVFNTHGVAQMGKSLVSPIMRVEAAMNGYIFANAAKYLKIKKINATQNDTPLSLIIRNDIVAPATLLSMMSKLFTATDTEWTTAVADYGNAVLRSATEYTLAIANVQKPFQMLHTALNQIGFEVLEKRFGYTSISLDIFGSSNIKADHICSLYALKFAKVEFNNTGTLSKTVTAYVPATIEGRPIKEFSTNYVLSTVESTGDYSALLDLSDFWLKKVHFISPITAGAQQTKCFNIEGYLTAYDISSVKWLLYGQHDIPAASVDFTHVNYLARMNHIRVLSKYIPFFGITLGNNATLNYLPDRVFGLVQVAYAPILDVILLRATTNFGVVA